MLPNPRGSTGFGQQFTDEITGDWGGKVYEDLMKGVDFAEALPYVDKGRIGAAGASFGGYMMNWFLGHTTRFKAIVTHASVYNLTSMCGVTEELWFPEWDLKGTPWTNPEGYAKWSPHMYAKNFKTPTLVTHGELDFRVPDQRRAAAVHHAAAPRGPVADGIPPGRGALDQPPGQFGAVVPGVHRLDGQVGQVARDHLAIDHLATDHLAIDHGN